ncbi:DUF4393 domain-containing protein [Skermania sp. ID1734]|uniref:Abi-alpha family protein n=1 Tax=Skermania sp. ID1734 TaxID=2597516 RepID=UPI00117CE78C|nr:Abi-alpha family protein [Skermania sp. ID1734]TSD96582.1 DUF4393 domain-containing protein [Skermania sp. ID1734]
MTEKFTNGAQTGGHGVSAADRAAQPAREAAAGSVSAAAELAKNATSMLYSAMTTVGADPLEATSTVIKHANDLNPVPGLVTDSVRTVRRVASPVLGADSGRGNAASDLVTLRRRGNGLIGVSHKSGSEYRKNHPAFALILDELTPDEARIVRFLAVAGPQPMIDVRTKSLFQIGSELLASDINMVAEMAGCRWRDQDRNYFANLTRLGLVRFSPEPVDDFRRYALIEVQPVAVEAIEKVKKSITIYRSIYLSEFGRQFTDVCFDTTNYHAGGWDSNERGDKTIGKGPPSRRQKS